MSRQGDWLSRIVLADVYPRKDDPFRPFNGVPPASAAPASLQHAEEAAAGVPGQPGVAPGPQSLGSNIYNDWMTLPGTRPWVYQRAYNAQINVGTTPLPIMNTQFQCDTIVISCPSTAANSVFFGYGSFITVGSGIEIRAGVPVAVSPDNTREQWELQRVLEAIAGMIARERGWNPIGKYRAPRVVFNAAEYFLVASAPTAVSVMVFTVPEMQ